MRSASIRQIIKAVGGSNIAIKKHFYYVSGFFDMVFSDKTITYYVLSSDVRFLKYRGTQEPQVIFREVKDRKDFTGGKNFDFNHLAHGAGFKVKMPSFKPQA